MASLRLIDILDLDLQRSPLARLDLYNIFVARLPDRFRYQSEKACFQLHLLHLFQELLNLLKLSIVGSIEIRLLVNEGHETSSLLNAIHTCTKLIKLSMAVQAECVLALPDLYILLDFLNFLPNAFNLFAQLLKRSFLTRVLAKHCCHFVKE